MRRRCSRWTATAGAAEPARPLHLLPRHGLESQREHAGAGSDVLDPADFSQEYGASNLDVRHSAAAMVIYEAPWKLHNLAGRVANGWMLSGIGQFRSGLPYTMRTSGSLAKEFTTSFHGALIVGLGPG
jgi:hypothetical protein